MAEPIGPGDWVECVDAGLRGARFWELGGEIVVGAIYSVREAFVWGAVPVITLNETSRARAEQLLGLGRLGYATDRFRPIYRPRAEFIESLKQPEPADAERVTA